MTSRGGVSLPLASLFFAAGASVALIASAMLKRRHAEQNRPEIRDGNDNKKEMPEAEAPSQQLSQESSQPQQVSDENTEKEALLSQAEEHCWKVVENSFTGALIYVCDKLNIYEQLWLYRPAGASAKDLASATGYSERWLLELLAQSTAAGFCQYDPDTKKFALKNNYAQLLRGPENEERSLAGMFEFLHGLVSDRPDATIQAAQTGIGVDYDFGESPSVIQGIERKNRRFFIEKFIPDIIEKVTVPSTGQSLVKLLESGVDCADIGCGCGMSTVVLAKRFPRSRFYAFEASKKSLEVLSTMVQKEGLNNVMLCDVAQRTVDQGPRPRQVMDNTFAFVYSHDLLHDMTDPQGLIRQVRSVLSRRGGSCWVIVDVKCQETLEKNIAMPSAALNFGFSCLLCLSSATSCSRARGLGTMGLHSALARQWMAKAGFEHFTELEIKHKPDNSCFVVA